MCFRHLSVLLIYCCISTRGIFPVCFQDNRFACIVFVVSYCFRHQNNRTKNHLWKWLYIIEFSQLYAWSSLLECGFLPFQCNFLSLSSSHYRFRKTNNEFTNKNNELVVCKDCMFFDTLGKWKTRETEKSYFWHWSTGHQAFTQLWSLP